MRRLAVLFASLVFLLPGCASSPSSSPGPGPALAERQADPLPSWNAGAPKAAILEFVARVSDTNGPDYVAPGDRIAVFDNDGTLIIERPEVVQFEFLYERIRQMAPDHPEWSDVEPFAVVLRNDRETLTAMNFGELAPIVTQGQANLFEADFAAAVRDFLATARHPRLDARFVDLVYQPMLELIDYLQAHVFRVFIVSGGGIEFIREFSEPAYGIAREQVIGSSMKMDLRERDGRLETYRKPGWNSLNAGRFKALNIQLHIGRRPILVVGNSDGDLDMMRFAHDGTLPSLVLLLRHDDAGREYDYAGETPLADEAVDRFGWEAISMRDDFGVVFPPAR